MKISSGVIFPVWVVCGIAGVWAESPSRPSYHHTPNYALNSLYSGSGRRWWRESAANTYYPNSDANEGMWWWGGGWGGRRRPRGRDPLELSGLPEGDILPHPHRHPRQTGGIQEKVAVTETVRLWPKGVIPYEFSTEFMLLPLERLTIERVMQDVGRKSCVRFVPRSQHQHHQQDYLSITVDRDRCYSHIGRVGGAQVLSLGLMCVSWLDLGPVYHELFHALGFYHEHNRPDRDNHVEIKWDNILDGSAKNFVRREWSDVELTELPYDINSVMHYSPFTFGKWYFFTPTIKSRKLGYNFWRRAKPSKMDYKKLNRLYKCRREGRRLRSRLGNTGPAALWQLQHYALSPHLTTPPLFSPTYS
ncbi:hypothetical protein Pcinc_034259 [Petrolisthes cinctipes]|uniref:Metalloendopeptidase n=1 Tax=Petrolisthes cinctipes TaxID=88211 RepID=A0AAE1EQN4_PETCI|nr:hypothetical protein Pcinc_034259 [Petrolisthes cinctipes]